MAAPGRTAKRAAREAEDSKPVEGMARIGLCGRGAVYLVVGLLALRVAFGGGGRADRNGALAALKDQPFGTVLLVALAAAFAGYAGWRLLEAVAGHRSETDDRKRWAKRFASLWRAVLYGSFAVTTIKFLATDKPGRDKTRPLTTRVLGWPAGQWLVGAVGVGLIIGGGFLALRGLRTKFLDKLALGGAPRGVEPVAAVTGLVGNVSRGVLVAFVGGFLIDAAVTYDPQKAKGLDATLKSLAKEPLGGALIGALGVGLLCFGVWSFVEARYRKV